MGFPVFHDENFLELRAEGGAADVRLDSPQSIEFSVFSRIEQFTKKPARKKAPI